MSAALHHSDFVLAEVTSGYFLLLDRHNNCLMVLHPKMINKQLEKFMYRFVLSEREIVLHFLLVLKCEPPKMCVYIFLEEHCCVDFLSVVQCELLESSNLLSEQLLTITYQAGEHNLSLVKLSAFQFSAQQRSSEMPLPIVYVNHAFCLLCSCRLKIVQSYLYL